MKLLPDRSRTIEILESRIAPATLVSPTTVTFKDTGGDLITVTITAPLFTTANVNKVFVFDTGSVGGDNSVSQQLETLNITKLGNAAHGMNVTISGGEGQDSVGFINASLIDLGDVRVEGDLGRIHAGDFTLSSPALHSLTVDTLGFKGVTGQAAGGNLESLISGGVGTLTVNHSVYGASVGVGGGAKGSIGRLFIGGSLMGGDENFSGSVRTQGGIQSTEVDGSILGGSGDSSGVIGTAGLLGSVLLKGDLTGGGGAFSGAILSQHGMTSVEIDGGILGGAGANSGQVGTDGTLAKITVSDSVTGGDGFLSGTILARGDLTSVAIGRALAGGSGASSGQVGAGHNIPSITIGGGIQLMPGEVRPLSPEISGIAGGSGASSGTVVAGGSLGTVDIEGNLVGFRLFQIEGAGGAQSGIGSGTISAHGDITSVFVAGNMVGASILSKGSINEVQIGGSMTGESQIHASVNIGSVSIDPVEEGIRSPGKLGVVPQTPPINGGIANSSIFADRGSIGSVVAGGYGDGNPAIGYSFIAAGKNIGIIEGDAVGNGPGAFGIIGTEISAGGTINHLDASSSDDTAMYNITVHTGGSINSIDGESFTDGEDAVGVGILNSHFQAGGSIGSIFGSTEDIQDKDAAGISGSAFNALRDIGSVESGGNITGSLFAAGVKLGSGFDAAGAGAFGDTTAAGFGFGKGSAGSVTAGHIGDITLDITGTIIMQSTFLAGVKGPGADGHFGTKDDSVTGGSSIGNVNAYTMANVFMESGSIGTTTTKSEVSGTTYIATGASADAGGIGAITIGGQVSRVQTALAVHPLDGVTDGGLVDSTFISNASIGNIRVTAGGFTDSAAAGISGGTFLAGKTIGNVTVFNNFDNEGGINSGIVNSTFKAGIRGDGGIGSVSVSCTQENTEDGGSTNYGISNTTFDASVLAGHSGNIGEIFINNSLDTDGDTPIGIDHSVFRAHGNIGNITVTLSSDTASAVQAGVFSAFGSIGNISITGSVELGMETSSHFLAGYDIGPDLVFGNENLAKTSPALQGMQKVGNVTVTGDFWHSDIAASVNPGAGYVFGDSTLTGGAANDSFTAGGGTIGSLQIATGLQGGTDFFDRAAANGIEAKTFTDGSGTAVTTFTFGTNTGFIPSLLSYDQGAAEVRVTNLQFVMNT